MERSDQYAVKIQELDQLSKVSKPCENTDAKYQWIWSLRSYKEKDQNRQIFLPLSTKNPLNSCVTARVNPFKKEEPVFLKVINKKHWGKGIKYIDPAKSKVHQLDIVKKKGYIKDLKDKITNKSLKIKQLRKVLIGDEKKEDKDALNKTKITHLRVNSPQIQNMLNPDRIENLANLYVDGDWKFSLEFDLAKKKEPKGYEIVLDHVIDNSGVGEPDESQEIIEENYQPTI